MMTLAAISPGPETGTGIQTGIQKQLKLIYQRISRQYPFLTCIGVAAPDTGDSMGIGQHCTYCSHITGSLLSHVMELEQAEGSPVIIDDLSRLPALRDEKLSLGVQSSLGLPLMDGNRKLGYTFFAAREKDCFTPDVIEQMNVYARVIARLLTGDKASTENLQSAVSSILQLNNANVSESPAHLSRVAQYSRLIAENCAEKYQLDPQWIDHLVMFAPLHDIGKVFIPESILMKPGRLTDEEFELIKTHTTKGRDIIDHMINSFGYSNHIHYTDMLRNIITHHHEAMDGSGYPHGLKGEDIPIEARIVATADILDALLTRRAYKQAWDLEEAMDTLRSLAGSRLDPDFVAILENNQERIKDIRRQYHQDQELSEQL